METKEIDLKHTGKFVAKDGTPLRYRPIEPSDTAYLLEIFENMSSESRYQRFHQTMDSVSETRKREEAAKIASADPASNFGILIFTDNDDPPFTPIAAVRYVVLEDKIVEAAMSVRDDFQNRGIGTFMLRYIAETARLHSMEKLVAEIQNSNEAVWTILNKLPYPLARTVLDEASAIDIDLTASETDAFDFTMV